MCRIAWDAACVLTFETAAPERIADIVGQAGAGGAVVHHAALGVEAAGAGTRIDTLVPEQKKDFMQQYIKNCLILEDTTDNKIRIQFFMMLRIRTLVIHVAKFNFDMTLP